MNRSSTYSSFSSNSRRGTPPTTKPHDSYSRRARVFGASTAATPSGRRDAVPPRPRPRREVPSCSSRREQRCLIVRTGRSGDQHAQSPPHVALHDPTDGRRDRDQRGASPPWGNRDPTPTPHRARSTNRAKTLPCRPSTAAVAHSRTRARGGACPAAAPVAPPGSRRPRRGRGRRSPRAERPGSSRACGVPARTHRDPLAGRTRSA